MQIKPSNILLDARGEARLADFGLARVAKQRAGTDATVASCAATAAAFCLLAARQLHPPPSQRLTPTSRVPQPAEWRGDGADGRLCLRRYGAHGADGAARH
eukprot:scaffold43852_cov73-Phaeocystis_antarctica.AAC.9